jgi:hypothetical protein
VTADPTSQSGHGQGQGQGHRRYPQPIHPLYVPNIPGKTNIPTFNANGNGYDHQRALLGRERYKEVIDEDTKQDMLDLFEVNLPVLPSAILADW